MNTKGGEMSGVHCYAGDLIISERELSYTIMPNAKSFGMMVAIQKTQELLVKFKKH